MCFAYLFIDRMVFWEMHHLIYSRIHDFSLLYYFICKQPTACHNTVIITTHYYVLIKHTKLSIFHFYWWIYQKRKTHFGRCACTRTIALLLLAPSFGSVCTFSTAVITWCRKIDTLSRQQQPQQKFMTNDAWCERYATDNWIYDRMPHMTGIIIFLKIFFHRFLIREHRPAADDNDWRHYNFITIS